MDVMGDDQYCCEHSVLNPNSGRVLCPLDPNHSVLQTNLEQHLKVCNIIKRQSLIEHYKENINLNQNSSSVTSVLLQELKSKEDFLPFLAVIETLFLHYSSKFLISSTSDSQTVMTKCSKTQKHTFQHESLYRLMQKNDFIKESTTFIELCAGKADFSRFIAKNILKENVQQASFALIDYKNFKRKRDVFLRHSLIPYKRLMIDIRNLDALELLNEFNSCNCVMYAKHACGKATDMIFSCLEKTIEIGSFRGLCLAFCCHHQTQWESFYGSSSLQLLTDEAQQLFSLMRQFSSWATCCLPENDTPHISGLSKAERESIGWKCKRIIDFSRIDSLLMKLNDFSSRVTVQLYEYTSTSVTLENICFLLTVSS